MKAIYLIDVDDYEDNVVLHNYKDTMEKIVNNEDFVSTCLYTAINVWDFNAWKYKNGNHMFIYKNNKLVEITPKEVELWGYPEFDKLFE